MSKVRKFRHLVLEISFFWIIPLNNYKNTSSGFSRGTESIGCCYYFPSFYPKKQTFCLRLLGRISLPSVGQAFLLLHAHIFTLCIAGVTWVEGLLQRRKAMPQKKIKFSGQLEFKIQKAFQSSLRVQQIECQRKFLI